MQKLTCTIRLCSEHGVSKVFFTWTDFMNIENFALNRPLVQGKYMKIKQNRVLTHVSGLHVS